MRQQPNTECPCAFHRFQGWLGEAWDNGLAFLGGAVEAMASPGFAMAFLAMLLGSLSVICAHQRHEIKSLEAKISAAETAIALEAFGARLDLYDDIAEWLEAGPTQAGRLKLIAGRPLHSLSASQWRFSPNFFTFMGEDVERVKATMRDNPRFSVAAVGEYDFKYTGFYPHLLSEIDRW